MRPIRVLHVINDLPYWLMHREAIASAALRAGMKVTVAAAPSPVSEAIKPLGYDFYSLSVDRFSLGFMDLKLMREVRDLTLRLVPDIVHLWTIKPLLFGGLALRFIPQARRPVVFGTVAGLGRGFSYQGAKRQVLVKGLTFGLGHVAEAVTFENPSDADTYVESGILTRDQARVFNGAGIDLSVFHPAAHRNDRPVTFLFASRLIRSKGVLAYVDAARRLKSIYGEQVRFLLGGIEAPSEPDALPAAILDAIKNDPAIEWRGSIPGREMPNTMRESDVFVLPSTYPEGLPRSCLEAGACGVAVIAGNVPGTRFLIEHQQDGILLEECSAECVAEAMIELLEYPDQRHRLAANLKRKIQTQGYSVESISERFLELYARCRTLEDALSA